MGAAVRSEPQHQVLPLWELSPASGTHVSLVCDCRVGSKKESGNTLGFELPASYIEERRGGISFTRIVCI